MKRYAKIQISDLLPLALTIVVAGIGITFGADVVSDIQDDFITGGLGCNSTDVTSCGTNYNVTSDTLNATTKFSGKLGLVATVAIAALVIGLLVRFFNFS